MNTIVLKNLIESVLDDEGLTDGLTDNDAQVIINWCINEIEKLFKTQSKEGEIIQQTDRIKQKAHLVCKIANDIQDDESQTKIRKDLEKIINNQDDLNQILALTESDKPFKEKIQLLLNM
jgi:hypothetical protein